VRSDRLPGGQGGSPEGLYVLPRGLFQVRDLRHQAHPEDVLQQSAHDQRQGGVLQQSCAQAGARDPGRVQRGHQERP